MVELEGGCRVFDLAEGEPTREGTLTARQLVGRQSGAQAISLAILEFAPGLSPVRAHPDREEVLFVLEGEAEIDLGGERATVAPETGIHLPPRAPLTVRNPGPKKLVMVSSTGTAAASGRPSVVRLSDQAAQPTADRWYRVLIDSTVTQFVGGIPPGRAPDHYHHYEEVLVLLRGRGRMWAGATSTEIAAGSCVFLPKKQMHCVENTGSGELVLLGCFYPAGSPAVRYS